LFSALPEIEEINFSQFFCGRGVASTFCPAEYLAKPLKPCLIFPVPVRHAPSVDGCAQPVAGLILPED
jgi:hypothetical protein